MRRSYEIIYQKLLETVKLQNLFKTFKEFFKKQKTEPLVSFTVIGFC